MRAPSPRSRLFPLDLAYARAGLTPPSARVIRVTAVPQPYRSLLDHQDDMTQTLERHHGGRVHVRTLLVDEDGPWYLRRVLLSRAASGIPVELGAIRLDLDRFPVRLRRAIRKADVPLGRLLREEGLDFQSAPRSFLAVRPNTEMLGVFWMPAPRTLYGRQTVLLLDGQPAGHIVEILPRTGRP